MRDTLINQMVAVEHHIYDTQGKVMVVASAVGRVMRKTGHNTYMIRFNAHSCPLGIDEFVTCGIDYFTFGKYRSKGMVD